MDDKTGDFGGLWCAVVSRGTPREDCELMIENDGEDKNEPPRSEDSGICGIELKEAGTPRRELNTGGGTELRRGEDSG